MALSILENAFAKSLCIGTRSSKRTDILHTAIGSYVINLRPDLTYKIEQKVETPIGTYKVDTTIYSSTEGPVLFILTKAQRSNIKQNETNIENSCIGEIVKLYKTYPKVRIVLFDFHPIECPYYKKDGTIKHIEKFSIPIMKEESKKFIELNDGRLYDKFTIFYNPDMAFEDTTDLDRFNDLIKLL